MQKVHPRRQIHTEAQIFLCGMHASMLAPGTIMGGPAQSSVLSSDLPFNECKSLCSNSAACMSLDLDPGTTTGRDTRPSFSMFFFYQQVWFGIHTHSSVE